MRLFYRRRLGVLECILKLNQYFFGKNMTGGNMSVHRPFLNENGCQLLNSHCR